MLHFLHRFVAPAALIAGCALLLAAYLWMGFIDDAALAHEQIVWQRKVPPPVLSFNLGPIKHPVKPGTARALINATAATGIALVVMGSWLSIKRLRKRNRAMP